MNLVFSAKLAPPGLTLNSGLWCGFRARMVRSDPRHLTLYIPGLWGPGLEGIERSHSEAVKATKLAIGGLRIPSLERLLTRGQSVAPVTSGRSLEEQLFGLFHSVPTDQGDCPVGALTRVLDGGGRDSAWYLRADPVHLRAEAGRVSLFSADELSLSPQEAIALATEINAHFVGDDWTVEALHPTRWYVRLARQLRIQTSPLSMVTGESVEEHLPRGPDAQRANKTLNEIQMILHGSEVNRERQSRGLLPINSVWFWGGGFFPELPASQWDVVWSAERTAQALAIMSHVPGGALPPGAEEWLLQADAPGNYLVVFSQLFAPACRGDVEGWRDAMLELESTWFTPLKRMLWKGSLQDVVLQSNRGRVILLTTKDVRRWWRRRKRLSDLINRNDDPMGN